MRNAPANTWAQAKQASNRDSVKDKHLAHARRWAVEHTLLVRRWQAAVQGQQSEGRSAPRRRCQTR